MAKTAKSSAALLPAAVISVAFLLSAGAAQAHCYTGPFPVTIAGPVPCIKIVDQSFAGSVTITNAGSVSPDGITVINSRITGSISDLGMLTGGISIADSLSSITNTSGSGIFIDAPTFHGGVANSGTSNGSVAGIRVVHVST